MATQGSITLPSMVTSSWPDPKHFLEWTVKQTKKLLGDAGFGDVMTGTNHAVTYLNRRDNDTSGPDKRRKSTGFSRSIAAVPSEEHRDMSAKEIQLATSGIQGTTSYKRQLPLEYHQIQDRLLGLEDVDLSRTSGLSAEAFCDTINELTRKWYAKLSIPTSPSVTEVTSGYEQDVKFLQLAAKVVIMRYDSQFLNGNDLSTFDGWKLWRDHVSVLICFAAYCGVVEAYLHKMYRKCGFESAIERGGE